MQTRTLGQQQVGAIGLGLMTFDQTGTQPREQLARHGPRRARRGRHPLRHRRRLRARRRARRRTRRARTSASSPGCSTSSASATGCCSPPRAATSAPRAAAGAPTARPAHLREAVDASLQRLGVDQIALWQHHRPDPNVAYDDVIGTLEEIARHAARSRMIGLSNADPRPDPGGAQGPRRRAGQRAEPVLARRSAAAGPRSTSARSSAWRSCRGARSAACPTPRSWPRSTRPSPRSPTQRGVSAQQVALAWELAQSPVVIPIPGAKRPESITDSAAAADLELTADELARLDAS